MQFSAHVVRDDSSRLVAAHLAGDPRAFTELVGRFRTRLLIFIDRMIGDRERAEDLVQEAFIRVHRHLHQFDPTRKFSSWVYTIASNLARNELRNRSRSPLILYESAAAPWVAGPVLQFADATTRPDVMFAERRLGELVEATMDRLSPNHREVFLLREVEGRSYEEIAQISHCTMGTVKSRLNRARRAFASLISPELD